jgi:hypothetical protein
MLPCNLSLKTIADKALSKAFSILLLLLVSVLFMRGISNNLTWVLASNSFFANINVGFNHTCFINRNTKELAPPGVRAGSKVGEVWLLAVKEDIKNTTTTINDLYFLKVKII